MQLPPPGRLGHHWRQNFASDPRSERIFLSSIAFFGAFSAARGVTHAIRRHIGPFQNMGLGGRHLHHLVFGISGLLGTGYLWLLQVGTGHPGGHRVVSRGTAVLYGGAAALTLDEFALWLNLQDVYWAKEGRESIDAVVLFGAVLSMGIWGGPFIRAVLREMRRV